jgi:hypothetical protein
MRVRSIGNSSHHIQKQLNEQHCENHATKTLQFLQAREPFQHQCAMGVLRLQTPHPIPPMQPVPKPAWFLAVYIRDVVGRIEETKAQLTSTFGSILKMDSTKKVSQTNFLYKPNTRSVQ